MSEFLPNPKTRYSNEWVELANRDSQPADLGGWSVDDGEGGGAPYSIPAGSVVAPGGLFLVTLPHALLNNDGDELRLMRPDGSVADSYRYSDSAVDQSFCRAGDGWVVERTPTPNAPNQCGSDSAAPPATQPDMPATAGAGPAASAAAPDGTAAPLTTPSPTPRQPAWSSEDLAGATPYALDTRGLPYRGLFKSGPTLQPSPTPTPRQEQAAPLAAAARPTTSQRPLARASGTLLLILGACIAGYQRLRRRNPAPPDEAPQESA